MLNSANIFNNGGNVGIGTSAPGQKLEVNGNISLPASTGLKSIYTWAPSDANWRIGMSDVPGFTRNLATSHVQYATYASGSTQGFAVGDVVSGLSSFEVVGSGGGYNAYFRGNVGFGVNPSYRLTVAGTGSVFAVDNQASFFAKNSGGGYETYFWPRWSDNVMYMNYGSGGMHIRNNGSGTTMFMTNGNSVGIGTTGPAYKLHVTGDIYADGGWFRVSGNQGYYFETHGGGWQMLDGTWIRAYNSKPILATGGLAGFGNNGLGTQYGGSPRIYANWDNVNGGGIAVADDGGFYDYNDGWVEFRGSTGLHVRSDNTSNLMLYEMYLSSGSGPYDKYIIPSNANWGYVGNSTNYFYRMYAGAFNTASLRSRKRDISPVTGAAEELVMADLDRVTPYFYKYKEEMDEMVAGKESKYRPNYHLGMMVDETPDYLQDESFTAIDLYAAATLGVVGAKSNRAEIKEIKQALGMEGGSVNLSDFGSLTLNGETTVVKFSEGFSKQLGANVPVVTLTSGDASVVLSITHKSSEGFTIRASKAVSGLGVDWIAMGKADAAPVAKQETLPANLMKGLRVSESDKARIQQYHVDRLEADKAATAAHQAEAAQVQAARNAEIKPQTTVSTPPAAKAVSTPVQGPRSEAEIKSQNKPEEK